MNPHQVWRAVLGELRPAMTPAAFEAWLQDAHALGGTGGTFAIAAPDDLAREWLAARFGDRIEAALERVTGRRVELAVVVEGARPGGRAARRHDPADAAVGHPPRHPDGVPARREPNNPGEPARR